MREMSIALFAASLVAATASTSHAAAPSPGHAGWFKRHRPVRGYAELGLFAGAFLPRDHELHGPRVAYEPLRRVGPDLGVRFGFYPLAYLGLEIESAMMPTRTTVTDSPATVVAARAHVLAQLPHRLAPFILVGYGLLASTSRRLGTDLDPALHYGGGLKLFVNHWVALRLDLRSNVTAQVGPKGGRTQHLEALLGVSVTLGRRPAPPRRQRASRSSPLPVPEDRCPDTRTPADACPGEARP